MGFSSGFSAFQTVCGGENSAGEEHAEAALTFWLAWWQDHGRGIGITAECSSQVRSLMTLSMQIGDGIAAILQGGGIG